VKRSDFRKLRRGDLLRIGAHLRVVNLGPADLTDPDEWSNQSIYLGKIRRNGYHNGATVYLYSDLGERARLVGHVEQKVLAADVARVEALGLPGRKVAARIRAYFRDEARLRSECARSER
jgi:hypothetical protein